MSFFTDVQVVDPTTGDAVQVNSDGQMHIVAEGHLCTNNSTSTPLAGGATWTGTSEDILAYNGIAVFVTSDVASATAGLEVQFSDDDSTWYTAEAYTIVAGAEKWFTPPAFGKFFRLRYTNGGSAQTTFKIVTTLRKMPFKWSSHNIEDPITDQDDATLTKAVITGKKASGDYDNVSLTNGGNMKASVEELESGISSNSNSQLNVTPFHADGTEGALLTGSEWKTGKDGIDKTTNVQSVIDYAHHEIHGGSTYRVQVFDDAIPATGSNGELVIGFYIPTGNKHPHMLWDFVHEGDMTMTLLEGVTLTLGTGTDVLCKNSRRDAGDTSFLQGVATGALVSNYVTKNPTYTGGTVVSLKRNYAARNVGAEGTRRNEVILADDTYYAFVLDNNVTSAQGGQIRLEWYEHTDRNV